MVLRSKFPPLLCVLALTAAMPVAAGAHLTIGGTGAATEPMRMIGGHFATATGIATEVIPSLGTAGAMNAVADGMLGIAVAARTPNAGEQARGMHVVTTVCTPYGLATSHPAPGSIDSTAVAALYIDAAPRWPDGLPLRIILRPKAETDNAVLAEMFPGVGPAIDLARQRPAVPIAGTDQDNADLAESIPGSLIGITYTQLMTERRALQFAPIGGVAASLEAFERGEYRYGKPLYVVAGHNPSSDITRFVDFLKSPDGRRAMREVGMIPCKPPG